MNFKLHTVKGHLKAFLNYQFKHRLRFKTHEIQELSTRGVTVFGRRLGSTETYTRCFRQLREDGKYVVNKLKSPNSQEAMWEVKYKND